jgi:hypothetical protein
VKRLLVFCGLVTAVCTFSLIGGAGLPAPLSGPTAAHADACNGDGSWPNCATVCAVTGNQCDQPSDGDVDYGWICSSFGDDCPDNGGGGECGAGSSLVGTNGDGAIYFVGMDGAFHWIPDADTFNAMGFDWGSVTWCDSLPDPPIGFGLFSVHQLPPWDPPPPPGSGWHCMPGDRINFPDQTWICDANGRWWVIDHGNRIK